LTTGFKQCCKCKVGKPLNAFGRLSEAKDGLTYACLDCTRKKMADWRANNRERDRNAKNKWSANNKDKLHAKGKRYYAENTEKHKNACNRWAKNNPAKVNLRFAKRRAVKLNATPFWLTAIQQAQIQEMYEVAFACTVQTGVQHHVDHIHPLQGDGFTGLHVPWNLRVIPAFENMSKNNRLPLEDQHMAWSNTK